MLRFFSLLAVVSVGLSVPVSLSGFTSPSPSSSSTTSSLRDSFNARASAYLLDTALSDDTGLYADLARLALGRGTFRGNDIVSELGQMRGRFDCSDFGVTGLIRILWQYSQSEMLSEELKQNITSALLDWQYWMDEANTAGGYFQGGMMFWTENHQFSFHSSEYLVGCLFPQTLFAGTNMTGQQHRERGKRFVTEWMQRRFYWGFSEFKSEVYLQFDIVNLANLAALAPDEEVQVRAQMILDLLLYDVSIHAHKGMITTARGRSYGADKFNIKDQSIAPTIQLLSGRGYHALGSGPAIVIALTTLFPCGYTVPDVVLNVAFDTPDELQIRERIGIDPTEKELAEATGLGLSSAEDGLVWWGDGAYASPETLQLIFVMGDTWNLYNTNETTWKYLKPFRFMQKSRLLKKLAGLIAPVSEGSVLGHAYSYLYRTPEAALGSAVDYNKGKLGYQQHAWQATLNGSTPVFTTAPGPFNKNDADAAIDSIIDLLKPSLKIVAMEEEEEEETIEAAVRGLLGIRLTDNHSSDYADGNWTGSSSMPRVGQWKNVLFSLYRPPWNGFPAALFPPRTHAFFPQNAFDEVADHLQDNGWILGRSGNGFVALYTSSKNVHWETQGDMAQREIVAHGHRCAWICVVSSSMDTSFDSFKSTILSSKVTVESDMSLVELTLPCGSKYSFGWEKDLEVHLAATSFVVPLSGFGRLESAYTNTTSFPASSIYLHAADGSDLLLDFDKVARTAHTTPNGGNTITTTTTSIQDIAVQVAHRCMEAMKDSGLFKYAHFSQWGYEAAVIQKGLWELVAVFPGMLSSLPPWLSQLLDAYETDPSQLGYKLVHKEKIVMPYGYSIGDHLGLYPIAYAARVNTLSAFHPQTHYNNQTDLDLIQNAAVDYVAGYPHRLKDNTLSRPIDWAAQGYFSVEYKAVWVDDAFMGTALLVDCELLGMPACKGFIVNAADQQLLFDAHLKDPSNGLYFHGYNNATGDHSCCKWGRGNGWALMAKVDVLAALIQTRQQDSPIYDKLLHVFIEHLDSIIKHQREDGLWNNIIDSSSSQAETSASAMYLYAVSRAIELGIVPKDNYAVVAHAAWQGLLTQCFQSDGTVTGILGETPIHNHPGGYDKEASSSSYSRSAPGLGAVFRAIAAYHRISNN